MQDWLLSRHGDYWVSGKAGSGKSTLMKFLCNHEKLERRRETTQQMLGSDRGAELKIARPSCGIQ